MPGVKFQPWAVRITGLPMQPPASLVEYAGLRRVRGDDVGSGFAQGGRVISRTREQSCTGWIGTTRCRRTTVGTPSARSMSTNSPLPPVITVHGVTLSLQR